MAEPVPERIAEHVRSRLAPIAAGGAIRPTRLGDFQPKDYQVVITQGDVIRNPALDCPGNPPAIARVIPFIVAGILRPSEKLTTPIATLKNEFWSTCVKAINTGSAWWNWNGLAIDSQVSDVENYSDEDGNSGFHLNLRITFRTDENDLTVVRS